MALNFTTLFTVIGKYVKSLNIFFGFLTQIQTGIDDIEAILETNTLNRLAPELHRQFELMKRDVENGIPPITQYWTTESIEVVGLQLSLA